VNRQSRVQDRCAPLAGRLVTIIGIACSRTYRIKIPCTSSRQPLYVFLFFLAFSAHPWTIIQH